MFDWMFERNVTGWIAFEETNPISLTERTVEIVDLALANATIVDRIEASIFCCGTPVRSGFYFRTILDTREFKSDDGKRYACLKVNVPESTWKKILTLDWITHLGEVV